MTENTGYFPPQYQPQEEQAGPSTAGVARDQAANVGRSAAQAGSQVAGTAAGQAKAVASETARHARDLVGEASVQVRNQASAQQQNAARQLRAVAGELQEMADKGGQSGPATQIAQQAAERLGGTASWLEQRQPADLVQAVRDFARRRPGAFLLGAAAAGLVVGRLTRGMTDAARSGSQDRTSQAGPGPAGQVTPAATIPPPPDPDWTLPDYPADTIPSATTAGPVASRPADVSTAPGATAGAAPYYPAAGLPGPGVAGPDDETAPGQAYQDLPDSGAQPYRPRQQP